MKSQFLVTIMASAALLSTSTNASSKSADTDRSKEGLTDFGTTVEQLRKESLELRRQLETMQRSLNRLAKSVNQKIVDQVVPLPKTGDTVGLRESPTGVTTPEFSIAIRPPTDLSFQRRAADPSASLQAYLQGARLEEQKLCRQAIEAFSSAVELDPRNDSALLHRGYCFSELGDYNNAAADLSHSLNLQPNNSRAYMARATTYATLGKSELAMADVNEVLLRDPQNSDGLSLRARLYEVAGDHTKASEDYSVLLAANPDSEADFLSRAIVLRNQGLASLALADCDNAVRVNPLSPAGYLCRAESYLNTGSSKGALEQLNQAVAAAQSLHQPLASLSGLVRTISLKMTSAAMPSALVVPSVGVSQQEPIQKDTDTAQNAIEAKAIPNQLKLIVGVAKTPSEASSVAVLATPFVATAGPETQLAPPTAALTKPSSRRQEDAVFYLRLARFRLKSSEFQEAIKAYTLAIEFDPTEASAYNGRGYAYLRLKKFDQAVADFSSAIRLKPNYINAFQNRAAAKRLLGNALQAREDIRIFSQLTAQSNTTKQPTAPVRLSSTAQSPNP